MRLKELREEKKLSQMEVATAINTSQRNISRWEKRQNEPTSTFIVQLADFFEVSTDYLLGRSDDFGVISISAQHQKTAELSPDGKELLEIFNGLNPTHRAQILEYARYFAERSKNAKRNF